MEFPEGEDLYSAVLLIAAGVAIGGSVLVMLVAAWL
jgi:hypothetical protein